MIVTLSEPEIRVSGALGEEDVRRALDAVVDPELDEPITDLGFVRSVTVTADAEGAQAVIHLRLPTSFCSPNFAYLMASDAKDAVAALKGMAKVVVELDDHHDSEIINVGLAADAGYRGTFRHEAEESLDELRWTFRRKAHTAAMERCLSDLLRSDPSLAETAVGTVRLRELPPAKHTDSLLRRRAVLGLPEGPDAVVLVDHEGHPYAPEDVPMALRRARSTRVSIDGNAHFCRGLLRTRYAEAEAEAEAGAEAEAEADQAYRPEAADHHQLLPITVKEIHP